MDAGVNALREHLRPTARAHRTITHGGIQPNIIADLGKIWWYVRDDTGPKTIENFNRVVKVAEGAAIMEIEPGQTRQFPFGQILKANLKFEW